MTDAEHSPAVPSVGPETSEVNEVEAVRADIEAARDELAQTVDALHDKLDVKGRASDSVAAAKERIAETAQRAKAAAPQPVQQALDRAGERAAPVVTQTSQQLAPHRGKIIAGAVGLLVVVWILRRRRAG
jgi:ElaB/YqjD/DUF883 family membrane-anchored ribosome-binding protein